MIRLCYIMILCMTLSGVKVNGHTSRGNNSTIFIFASLLNGSALKEYVPQGAESYL